jgi:hypothetical protein
MTLVKFSVAVKEFSSNADEEKTQASPVSGEVMHSFLKQVELGMESVFERFIVSLVQRPTM